MSYGGYQQPPAAYPPPGPGYGYTPPPPTVGYAGFGKRLLAYIVDRIIDSLGAIPGVILAIVGAGLAVGASAQPGGGADVGAAAFGIVFLAYGLVFVGVLAIWLYNCYLLGRDGASLGKKMLGLKVLDPTGQPLGFGRAILRELVKSVLGGVCFILLLWPLWDDQKQGLQDKLFNTHVYDA